VRCRQICRYAQTRHHGRQRTTGIRSSVASSKAGLALPGSTEPGRTHGLVYQTELGFVLAVSVFTKRLRAKRVRTVQLMACPASVPVNRAGRTVYSLGRSNLWGQANCRRGLILRRFPAER